jgi:hypothetical protein
MMRGKKDLMTRLHQEMLQFHDVVHLRVIGLVMIELLEIHY